MMIADMGMFIGPKIENIRGKPMEFDGAARCMAGCM